MSAAPDFDTLLYFGDSLSDSGGFFNASSKVAIIGIPFAFAGYDQKFSNGPVYADRVPDLIGVEGGPEQNYAVGGARILADRTMEDVLGFFPPIIKPDASPEDLAFGVDYRHEIERFVAALAPDADLSDQAASILIGANDLRDFERPIARWRVQVEAAQEYGERLARGLRNQTEPLVEAGIGTVILNTLPEPSVFPASRFETLGNRLLGDVIVESYNDALAEVADTFETLGADVIILELGIIFEEVVADAASFGFRRPTLTVNFGEGAVPIPNPAALLVPDEQIAFFDQIHPTTDMHGIIAAYQAASLTHEVIIGTAGEDQAIVGTEGDDLVVLRDGNDSATLGGGDDIALGGLGDDELSASTGANLLIGGDGDDALIGGDGPDILADGLGDDLLQGGEGDDLLLVGQGSDTAEGGAGDDIIVWTSPALIGVRRGFDRTTIDGGGGEDTLVLQLTETQSERLWRLRLDVEDVEDIQVVRGLDEDFPILNDQTSTADLWHLI